MKEELKEQWMRLCEQAAQEQNPEKLMALVREINRLLDEKRDRLKRSPSLEQGQARAKAVD